MSWNNGMRLKPETAAEVNEVMEPRGIRKRLNRYRRDSALVNAVFNSAYAQGLSGEDTMTVLAYEALLRLEQYDEAMLEDAMLNIKPQIIIKPST